VEEEVPVGRMDKESNGVSMDGGRGAEGRKSHVTLAESGDLRKIRLG